MQRAFARTAGAALATTVVAASLAFAPAAGAQAVSTGTTAFAAPAATGSASLAAALSLTGAVGGLLDGIIGPIVSTALNPLVAALQGSVNGLVGSTLGASSSLAAGSPAQQSGPSPATFPGDLPAGLPSPCTTSSTTRPCFTGVSLGVNAAPLATVGVSALSGYTAQVPASNDSTNPSFGRAQVASPTIAALPGLLSLTNPVVRAGVVDAQATCPNDGSTAPSAKVSASGVSVLGGLITLSVLNGSIAGLVVNGVGYGTIASLPVIAVGGITIRSYGTAIRVDIPLTLDQLVGGLGLPTAALTELLDDATSSSLKLSVVVGPSVAVTSTSAKAWALGVGLDLSGSVNFNLLGLAGATLTLPSGIGSGNYGNTLDLRLGYTACTVGSATTRTMVPAVPPALV